MAAPKPVVVVQKPPVPKEPPCRRCDSSVDDFGIVDKTSGLGITLYVFAALFALGGLFNILLMMVALLCVIAGALLKKKVHLYRCSNHGCRATRELDV